MQSGCRENGCTELIIQVSPGEPTNKPPQTPTHMMQGRQLHAHNVDRNVHTGDVHQPLVHLVDKHQVDVRIVDYTTFL